MSCFLKDTLKKLVLFVMTLLFILYSFQPMSYLKKSNSKEFEFMASTTGSTLASPGKFNIYAYSNADLSNPATPINGVQFKLWQYYWDGNYNTLYPMLDQWKNEISTTDATGYISFTGTYKIQNGFPYYYVEVVGTPLGYRKYPPYTMVKRTNLLADNFYPHYGDYWGPYYFTDSGNLSVDTGTTYRPFTQHNQIVQNNSAYISFDLLYTNYTFTKKDSTSGLVMSGVTFNIIKDNNSIPYKNPGLLTTGTDGKLFLKDLTVGTYTLKENRPAGYEINQDIKFDVVSDADQQTCYVTNVRYADGSLLSDPSVIPNKPTTLRIQKVDEYGKPLNAQFTLRNSLGQAMPFTSPGGSTGLFYFEKLLKGTYELSETLVPFGYKAGPSKWNVDVSNDGLITVENDPTYIKQVKDTNNNIVYNITNYQLTTDFHFVNVDKENGKTLDEATFTLKSLTDSNFTPISKVSGKEAGEGPGEVLFSSLKVGTYELVQTIQRPGYIIQNIKVTFEVVLNADGTFAEIKNIKATDSGGASIESPLIFNNTNNRYEYNNLREKYAFYLKDPQGNPLPNANFTVTNDADPSIIYYKTSDQTGKVTLNRTASNPNSTFTIIETKATSGYQMIVESWKIQVDQYGIVKMVPPTYNLNDPDKQYRFTGTSVIENSTDQMIVTNVLLNYDFKFTKIGNKQLPLENAQFTLTKIISDGNGAYTNDSTFIPLVVSSLKDGSVRFDNLPLGIFKLQETGTPSGYISNSNLYDLFEIKLNLSSNTLYPSFIDGYKKLIQGTSDTSYTVVNSLDTFFKFTLYGFTGNETGTIVNSISATDKVVPLTGAKFSITDKATNTETFAISDSNGIVSFPEAELNKTYIFKQIDTPTTHLKALAEYEVIFTDPGSGVIADMKMINTAENFVFNQTAGKLDYVAVNKINDIVIQVKKVGDNGGITDLKSMPGLEGAIYEIYEYDLTTDTTVGDPLQITSDSQGLIKFEKFALPGKVYRIYEVLAPPNYHTDGPSDLYGTIRVGLDKTITFDSTLSIPSGYWTYDNTRKRRIYVLT